MKNQEKSKNAGLGCAGMGLFLLLIICVVICDRCDDSDVERGDTWVEDLGMYAWERDMEERKELEEEEKFLASSDNPCNNQYLVESLKQLGKKCNPYKKYDILREMKASGIWCDNPEDDNRMVRCDKLKNLKDICLDLGAKFKNGKCEFSVKKEPIYGRAGLERKFPSCQIDKIIAGKGNTATVRAVCNSVGVLCAYVI